MPVTLDLPAFIVVTSERGILPANPVQFDRPNPGVTFDCQERVGRLDRPMLPSVAGQDQPRVMLAAQSNQFEHLPSANLTGLIHDDGSVIGEFTFEEKLRHGGRRRKTGLLHVHDLLPLRGKNDHWPVRLTDLLDQFSQHETLAGAGTATEYRNRVG